MTQGAVSQQVKGLEAELGVRLFRRERQRLIITDAGRSYLEVVRDAFDRLGTGTERLLSGRSPAFGLSPLPPISPPNGSCTGSGDSPRLTLGLICASAPQFNTSISRAKILTWQSATETDNGPECT